MKIGQPRQGETIAGLFIRLSETQDWPPPDKSAALLGITLSDMRWGTRQRRGNSVKICGHRLPIAIVEMNRRRICTHCLAEDRFLREWWELGIFASCPIHGGALQDRCSCGQDLGWSDTRIDTCGECEREDASVPPLPRRTPSDAELWLATKLKIGTFRPDAWWDSGTGLSFTVQFLTNLGQFAARGYSDVAPAELRDVDALRLAMDSGIAVLERDGLDAVVSRSVEAFQSASSIWCPKRPLDALGWFGDWFGNEELSNSHPISVRLHAAIEMAFGFSVGNLSQTGVENVSVLAERLGISEVDAIEFVQARLKGRTFRGPYVPTSIASEIETLHFAQDIIA